MKMGWGPVLWWYHWIFGHVAYPMLLMILYYSHFDCKQPELNSLSHCWVELFLWLATGILCGLNRCLSPISPGKVSHQMGSASSSILPPAISGESCPRNICYSMLLWNSLQICLRCRSYIKLGAWICSPLCSKCPLKLRLKTGVVGKRSWFG